VARDDGTGSATTTLEDVTLSQIFDPDKKRYIALHARSEEGQGVPPVISCADVVEAAAAGAVSTKLPESGGTSPAVLFVSGAILALGAIAGLLALRRLGA
jgi:LPXTG-motif cell wall-anchored protein